MYRPSGLKLSREKFERIHAAESARLEQSSEPERKDRTNDGSMDDTAELAMRKPADRVAYPRFADSFPTTPLQFLPPGPHCSNNAIDSTCAVCGNMFTTPAAFSL